MAEILQDLQISSIEQHAFAELLEAGCHLQLTFPLAAFQLFLLYRGTKAMHDRRIADIEKALIAGEERVLLRPERRRG